MNYVNELVSLCNLHGIECVGESEVSFKDEGGEVYSIRIDRTRAVFCFNDFGEHVIDLSDIDKVILALLALKEMKNV